MDVTVNTKAAVIFCTAALVMIEARMIKLHRSLYMNNSLMPVGHYLYFTHTSIKKSPMQMQKESLLPVYFNEIIKREEWGELRFRGMTWNGASWLARDEVIAIELILRYS